MASRKKKKPAETKILVSAPELVRLDFTRHDGVEQHVDEEIGLTYNLRLARISLYSIGIELELVADSASISCKAAYRAIFTMELTEGTPPEVYEPEMQRLVAHFAPSTLYPFVREAILNTVVRSGLPPFVLPVTNFRQMFDPDQIVLPLVMEGGGEQPDSPES
jgi:hypothetical protein